MPQGGNPEPNAQSSQTLHDAVRNAFTQEVGTDKDVNLKVNNATGEVEIKDGAAPNLVKQRQQQQQRQQQEEKVDGQEVKEDDNTDDKKGTEENDDVFEIDASSEEIGHALALHRGLADPKQRGNIIRQLFQQAGLEIPQTKQEEKKAAVTIDQILKEVLGESYDIHSGDKLAVAFERYGKLLLEQFNESVQPLQQRVLQAEERAHREEADAAMSNLWAKHKVPQNDRAKISEAMMRKMKQFAPGEGVSASEYLDSMYSLAMRDVETARAVKTTVKRIQRNAQDVRDTSGDGGSDDKRIKTGSRLPSIRESIAAAYRGETLEE